MKTKTGCAHYRQGDVIIERIDSLPENIKKVARQKGRVVLAEGKATGHAHVFSDDGSNKFLDDRGREYFRIAGNRINAALPVAHKRRSQVTVQHPTLGAIEFAIADVELVGNTVNIDGKFGLLTHDEHNTQAIPAGFYRGGNAEGTVNQREYSPEEIRRVDD